MFAIDGVKLPSNASQSQERHPGRVSSASAESYEAAAQVMLERHRESDAEAIEPDLAAKDPETHRASGPRCDPNHDWLEANPNDRRSGKGRVRKSNRTDNDSAKMATSKGVIQGYTGVAAVDDRHQIIVEAQAHGTGSEQELLMPVVAAIAPELRDYSLVTADAGYHSEANLKALAERNVDALIADNGMRQRDERFKDQAKHKAKPDPLHDKRRQSEDAKALSAGGFQLRRPDRHLRLPGREAALPERCQLQSQRIHRREVPGRAARLRALQSSRAVPAQTRPDPDAAGLLLSRQSRQWHREFH